MRMWMVDPEVLCRKHLLGEHLELHMFVGHLRLGRKVEGYVANNLLESAAIAERHEALAKEMELRGYWHTSPIRYKDVTNAGKIDRLLALQELLSRCPECKQRYTEKLGRVG